LLDQKKYDEACPKLAEAQKLDPGAGTLLALALCHEGQGKTATARKELEEAASLGKKNGRMDLAKAAEKRAAAMEPTLSKIVVRMPEGAPDYEVRLDGQPVTRESLGAPIPVDPGEHKADVSAKGKAPRSYVVRLSGAGTVEIVIDKLEDASKPAVAAAATKAKPAEHTMMPINVEPPHYEDSAAPGGAQRAIGLTAIGLGVAGLGVGGFFAVRAIQQHNEGRECSPGPCTSAESADANDRAKASTTAAVISGSAGIVAIGAGTILFFTAPSRASRAAAATPPRATAHVIPQAGPSQVGLGVIGTF
jgi:hypothetical protein